VRPEYAFDFAKAKPNPYVARLDGWTVAVVLEGRLSRTRELLAPR